jgi:hypothetical protein
LKELPEIAIPTNDADDLKGLGVSEIGDDEAIGAPEAVAAISDVTSTVADTGGESEKVKRVANFADDCIG